MAPPGQVLKLDSSTPKSVVLSKSSWAKLIKESGQVSIDQLHVTVEGLK